MLNPFSPADENNIFANRIEPDETAHNEPSHQDLHCLPFCNNFLTETPIWKNGSDQIQRWKSLLRKHRGEKVNKVTYLHNVTRRTQLCTGNGPEPRIFHHLDKMSDHNITLK